MTDIFYYTGFLYIAREIFIMFQKSNNKQLEDDMKTSFEFIPKNKHDITGLNNSLTKSKSLLKMMANRFDVIVSIFFLAWIITGIYKTQQSALFIAIFYSGLFPVIVVMIIISYSALQTDDFANAFIKKIKSMQENKEKTFVFFLNKSLNIICIILVAVILYIHFFNSQFSIFNY